MQAAARAVAASVRPMDAHFDELFARYAQLTAGRRAA
jgi:hypothetical protein